MRTVGLTPHLLDRWCVTVQSVLPHLKHLLRRSTKADLLPLPGSPRENHFPSQGKFKDMLMLTKDWLTLQSDHCRWGGTQDQLQKVLGPGHCSAGLWGSFRLEQRGLRSFLPGTHLHQRAMASDTPV